MSHHNLVALVITLRVIAGIVALICSFMLAKDGKSGWGWMLFVALWLGAVTVGSGEDGDTNNRTGGYPVQSEDGKGGSGE